MSSNPLVFVVTVLVWGIPSSAQGFFLVLHSGVIPDIACGGAYGMPTIKLSWLCTKQMPYQLSYCSGRNLWVLETKMNFFFVEN